MSVAEIIKDMQNHHIAGERTGNLEIVERIRKQQNSDDAADYSAPKSSRGMDRSQEFRPVARPSFLRG